MDNSLFTKYQLANDLVTRAVAKSGVSEKEGLQVERNMILEEMRVKVNLEAKANPFYFIGEIKKKSITWSKTAFGVKFCKIRSIEDLLYLKSVAQDAKNRGRSYSQVIFGLIKVKPVLK